MKVDATQYANFLGFAIQGDLGPLTMYRAASHKVVIFPMTWPKEPATAWQIANRERFRTIAAVWSTLLTATRAAWLRIAYVAHLRITGYNLFTYYMIKADAAAIATLEQQTGIDLHPLPEPFPPAW